MMAFRLTVGLFPDDPGGKMMVKKFSTNSSETCLNGSVGVRLILLASFQAQQKLFLHKLTIIQSKLCKCIQSHKGRTGVVVYCHVRTSEPIAKPSGGSRESDLQVVRWSVYRRTPHYTSMVKGLTGTDRKQRNKQRKKLI